MKLQTDEDGIGPGGWLGNISKLTLKPEEGSATPNEYRQFSVYIPAESITDGEKAKIELLETFGEIELNKSEIELSNHPNVEGLLWGHFSVKGPAEGDSTWIKCILNNEEDLAYFEVKTEEKNKEERRRKKKKPRERSGGFFKDVKANSDPNPQQRVAFLGGVIFWFTEFPVVKDYLIENRLNTSEGKILFAEMISEAVCGALATKRLTEGLIPGRPNENASATVGRYAAEVNRIKRRSLAMVYRWAKSYNIETDDDNKERYLEAAE